MKYIKNELYNWKTSKRRSNNKKLIDENITLREELSQLNRIVDALHQATLGLLHKQNIHDILEAILCNAAHMLHCNDGYIYLLDPLNNTLQMEIGIGLYKTARIYNLSHDKGFGGAVWRHGEILVIKDYSIWPDRLGNPWLDSLREVVGVPLKAVNWTMGIFVLCAQGTQEFSPNDLKQLQRFAEIASLALSNARLYEDLRNELRHRHEAEINLQVYANRMHAIIDSAEDYIFIKDINGMYQVVNPAMGTFCNANLEDIIGKNGKDFFDDDTVIQISYTDQKILQGLNITEEIEITRNNKLYIYQQIKTPLRDADGTVIGICCIGRDITNMKNVEKELIRSKDEYSKVERLVSLVMFNAAISHEINQPLNFIKLTSSSILYWHNRDSPRPYNEIIDDVTNILRQAQRIEEIIHNFRNTCILDESGGHVALEQCRLDEIIASALELMADTLSRNHIRLKKFVDPRLPAAWGTPLGLQQVFTNLLTNAMEAVLGNKDTDREILLRLFAEPALVILEILDNGPGLARLDREKLFSPFFTTKEPGRNMGLGLAVVRYFTRLFQGNIIAGNREPPPGALFRLELKQALSDEAGSRG